MTIPHPMPLATPLATLTVFSDLVSKYPSWSDLKTYLQASEPGLDILETEGSPYVIIRNSREQEVGDAPAPNTVVEEPSSEMALVCRSVIWNTATNLPCCVAPFAARRDHKIPFDTPLQLEDFVEGVMINVFRSKGDSQTHVSTRSRIDADGKFYSERSFRDLFDEALTAKKSSLADIEAFMGVPSDGIAATFVTLVLAHPEHRVVRTVDEANLWAIYRGVVKDDGTVEFSAEGLPSSWHPKSYSTNFKAATWAELKAKFEEIRVSKPWYWQGLVVHQSAGGQRWRLRNGDHDRVRKELRGTESNSFGRFLRLRATKKVQEYLRIYTEDSTAFQGFERDYRTATKTLYTWYCRCHKEHSFAFKSLPKSVQPLIFELHKHYLETLRPNKTPLHLLEVISWITEYLKGQYGVSNMLRFLKESEQPPASKTAWPQATPQAKPELLVHVDESHSAVAPVSPAANENADV